MDLIVSCLARAILHSTHASAFPKPIETDGAISHNARKDLGHSVNARLYDNTTDIQSKQAKYLNEYKICNKTQMLRGQDFSFENLHSLVLPLQYAAAYIRDLMPRDD